MYAIYHNWDLRNITNISLSHRIVTRFNIRECKLSYLCTCNVTYWHAAVSQARYAWVYCVHVVASSESSTRQFIFVMYESNHVVLYFRNSAALYHSTYFFPPNLTGISPPVLHGFPVRALLSFPVWYISDPYKTEPWPVSKFRVGSLSGEQITILITVLITALLIHLFRLTLCTCYSSVICQLINFMCRGGVTK